MNHRQRIVRRDALLNEIHQQRLDLTAACHDWCDSTARLDQGWLKLRRLRHYLAVGSGIVAIWSVRKPSTLFRWARRGAGVWSTWRLLRKGLKR